MGYEKSRIYQKAFRVALGVEPVCRRFPQEEKYVLAQQLRRAARSIAANYVEGYSREKTAPSDFRRYLIMSQGSCDETTYWLNLAADLGLMDTDTSDQLRRECFDIGCLLRAVISRMPSRHQTTTEK